jgi:hypothetical protein
MLRDDDMLVYSATVVPRPLQRERIDMILDSGADVRPDRNPCTSTGMEEKPGVGLGEESA